MGYKVFIKRIISGDYNGRPKKEKPMAMSKDRVRFKIPCRRLNSTAAESWRRNKLKHLLVDVFGIKHNDIPRNGDLTIICRPSQFARFVILRHDLGLENWFSELETELFVPELESGDKTIDVHKNHA